MSVIPAKRNATIFCDPRWINTNYLPTNTVDNGKIPE